MGPEPLETPFGSHDAYPIGNYQSKSDTETVNVKVSTQITRHN